MIDQDNSGFINIKEMIEFLQSVCDDEVDESEVRGIFSKMDVTGDRTIDFWEFEVGIFINNRHLMNAKGGDGTSEKCWMEEGPETQKQKRQHLHSRE